MLSVSVILETMYRCVSGISKRTELQERPSSTSSGCDDFVVVSLAGSIANKEIGQRGEYGYFSASGFIKVFVRDRTSGYNPNAVSIVRLDALTREVLDRLPHADHGRGVKLYNPTVVTPCMSDGKGFHYSVVQVDITTML